MSDMVGLPFPDYSVAGESAGENIRNAQMLLGGLRHVLAMVPLEIDMVPALDLVVAISARLDKALQQVEAE